MSRVFQIFVSSLLIVMAALYSTQSEATAMDEYSNSELWFNALPNETRLEIQSALIWSGGYNQFVDGVFGASTLGALKAFEKRSGVEPDGILGNEELARLQADAAAEQRKVGFQPVSNEKWQLEIKLPLAKLSKPEEDNDGTGWKSLDARLYIVIGRYPYTGASFPDTYRSATSEIKFGQVKYRTFRPGFFVISGVDAETQIYLRAHDHNGSAIAFLAIWRRENDADIRRLVVAISNSLKPLTSTLAIQEKSGTTPSTDTPKQSDLPERFISTGTAFFVSEAGHLLTNEHVVNGCPIAKIRLADGRVTDAEIVARNPKTDLAILRTPIAAPSVVSFRISPPLRLGSNVIVFGYPRVDYLTSTGNLVSGLLSGLAGPNDDATLLQISAPVQTGNSGGAVLDQSGNVVGIVKSKLNLASIADQIEVIQQANFAINADVARSFLAAQKVPFSTAASSQDKQTTDIADTAREFTALVWCELN